MAFTSIKFESQWHEIFFISFQANSDEVRKLGNHSKWPFLSHSCYNDNIVFSFLQSVNQPFEETFRQSSYCKDEWRSEGIKGGSSFKCALNVLTLDSHSIPASVINRRIVTVITPIIRTSFSGSTMTALNPYIIWSCWSQKDKWLNVTFK